MTVQITSHAEEHDVTEPDVNKSSDYFWVAPLCNKVPCEKLFPRNKAGFLVVLGLRGSLCNQISGG